MAELLAVKETAPKPVKPELSKQAAAPSPATTKNPAETSQTTADAMELDEAIQKSEDDSEDDVPLASKSVTCHGIRRFTEM